MQYKGVLISNPVFMAYCEAELVKEAFYCDKR
jgi:hypothetical protein